MIEVKISGADALERRLNRISLNVRESLANEITKITLDLPALRQYTACIYGSLF